MFPPLVPDRLLAAPGSPLTTIAILKGFKTLGSSHTGIHPLATLCRYYGCFGDNSSVSRSDIGFSNFSSKDQTYSDQVAQTFYSVM